MRHASPRRYAAGTSVPVERSRAELERLIQRAGATRFGTKTVGAFVIPKLESFPRALMDKNP